jgi:ABC-type nitrate/sulfonate/bicarbonate transport system substrate-binding protein
MRRAIALVLVGSVLLAACAPAPAASPAPPAPERPAAAAPPVAAPAPPTAAAPGPPLRITVAYSTASAATSPMQLAQDRGVFRDAGLEVELIHAMGNTGPAAVISGQAQALAGGCTEAVNTIAGGADLVIVLVSVSRLQYMLVGSPTIAGPHDLRGKRFAVSRIGSSSHLATKFMVKYLGYDPDHDVSYLQVGNTPERVAALLAGSVDGSILSADEGTLLGAQPGMHVLIDMSRENIPYCGNAIVVTRQLAREQPEIVRRLARAVTEAHLRFKYHKPEGLEAIARFIDEQDLQKVEQLWQVWIRMYPDKPYPDPRGIQFVLDEAGQADPRVRALTPEQVSDATFVRELDESGFIDRLLRSLGAS